MWYNLLKPEVCKSLENKIVLDGDLATKPDEILRAGKICWSPDDNGDDDAVGCRWAT